MRNPGNRLHPLSLSLQLALAAMAIPSVANALPLYAGPGTTTNTTGATFNDSATDGFTFLAEEGGKIQGDATVNNGGDNGAALLALTKGAISLSDSAITATGADGAGAWTEDEGVITLKNSIINASGLRAIGAMAWDGTLDMDGGSISVGADGGNALRVIGIGTATSKNQTLTTAGQGTEAVRAEKGGHATLTGSKVLANGSGSRGVVSSGVGSVVDAVNAEIAVEGTASHGVLSTGGGTVNLVDSKVVSKVDDNRALIATGAGSSITASGTEVTSTGTKAIGASVQGGGAVRMTDGSSITMSGDDSYGVSAINTGSSLTIDGSSVETSGASGSGAIATDKARLTITNGANVSTSGANATGLHVEGGAIALVEGSSIVTGGDGAYGAAALGAGTELTLDGSTVETSGASGWGAAATSGAHMTVTNAGAVTTTGKNAVGVHAESGSVVTVDGKSSVQVSGDGSRGVSAMGAGSSLTVDGSTVDTQGENSLGAVASDGAQLAVQNGSAITTSGKGAYGVVVTGTDSVLAVDASTVSTAGEASPAAVVQAAGQLSLKAGAKVEATGTDANALEITGADSKATADHATLTSAKAAGIVMAQGTTTDLVDTAVTGSTHAVGFVANGTTPVTTPATLTVTGGSLTSDLATLQSQGITANVTLADGVTATSGNGELARAKDNSILSLTLRNVSLKGDAIAETGSALDLNLDSQATLEGAVHNGRQLSIADGSLWTMTASSDVASALNAGRIAFAQPSAGGFKTLTVHGDYTGDNGLLTINTVLGDDASQTDRLIVQGNTSGNTNLHVNNAGGAGAYTTADGIQVVQVDGASGGTFALDAPVVAGVNEYLLAKGGKTDPANGDWYLRSEAPPVDPVDPTHPVDPTNPVDPTIPVDPTSPVDPTDPANPVDPTNPDGQTDPAPVGPVGPVEPLAPVTPLYRPEPAAYLANQAAAVGMFEHSMHDRMGEPNLGKRDDDGRSSAAWVRVVRNQRDGTTGEGQLDAGTDNSVLQIGGEIARWNDDSRFHLGLMGGTGRADSEVTSNLIDRRAKGQVIGYNLGVYGTWFANATSATGLYLDSWLQYGRYDNKVQGDLLAMERYDASTWAASIEAGYAFALNEDGKTRFFVEPQAQAIFTDYSMSQHRENNGTLVDDVDAGGLTTRLGVRFYGHAASAQQNLVQPFVTLNWWHDEDNDRMSFNDTTLELQTPRDRYEAKLGLQTQLGGGWTGWGNLGLTYGARDYQDVTGQLGLNYRW